MELSDRKKEREKAFATWADKFAVIGGRLVPREECIVTEELPPEQIEIIRKIERAA